MMDWHTIAGDVFGLLDRSITLAPVLVVILVILALVAVAWFHYIRD